VFANKLIDGLKCCPIFEINSPLDSTVTVECGMESLNIPSFLKRVDALPCETWCSKIDIISTLIRTCSSLFVVRHEVINRVIGIFRYQQQFTYLRCGITLSFLIDSGGLYFSASCAYPDIRCIIRGLQSKSAIM